MSSTNGDTRRTAYRCYNSIKRVVYAFQDGGGEPDKVEISQELRDLFADELTTIAGLPIVVSDEHSGMEFTVHHTKTVSFDPDAIPRGVEFTSHPELNQQRKRKRKRKGGR